MGRWERGRPNTLAQQRLQQMRMGHENVLLRKKTQRIASTRFLRLWWPTLRVAVRIGIHRPQEWGLHGEKALLVLVIQRTHTLMLLPVGNHDRWVVEADGVFAFTSLS